MLSLGLSISLGFTLLLLAAVVAEEFPLLLVCSCGFKTCRVYTFSSYLAVYFSVGCLSGVGSVF